MIGVTIDVRDLLRLANDTWPGFERQVPFAISYSLLDVARDVRADLIAEMDAKFDRPTPWVKRGMLVQAPKKDDVKRGVLEARVYANDGRDKGMGTTTAQILVPHLAGGGRRMKRSERKFGSYVVPGSGATLDNFGNIRNAELVQALSALGKASGSGYEADRTENSKKRNKRLRTFFQRGNVIFERKGKTVKPVLVMIGEPNYQPVLDWSGRASAIVAANYRGHFLKRMEGAVATARP